MREGWVETTLGEVVMLNRHRTDPRTAPAGTVLMHWSIPAYDETGAGAREPASSIKSHKFRVSRDAVLVSLLNPRIPRHVVVNGGPDVVCSTEFAVLEPGQEVALRFLGIFVSSVAFSSQIETLVTGTTGSRQRVKPQDLLSIRVSIPSLAEQRRIVDLVDSLAAYIARADARAAAAETARRLIVGDELSNSRGWPIRELGDVVDIAIGRQRSPQHASGDHMVPYLRAANVKDGAIDLTDVKSMNFTPAEQATFRLEAGDVLVTEGCGSIAELGASSYWRGGELTGTVCFQNTLLRLRAIEGVTTPDFVELFARYAHHSGLWAEVANGTNIFHIGLRRARQVPIALPSLETQKSLSAVSKALQRDASAAESAALMGRRLRSAVLNDLLTGKHEIPGSYDALLGVAA